MDIFFLFLKKRSFFLINIKFNQQRHIELITGKRVLCVETDQDPCEAGLLPQGPHPRGPLRGEQEGERMVCRSQGKCRIRDLWSARSK